MGVALYEDAAETIPGLLVTHLTPAAERRIEAAAHRRLLDDYEADMGKPMPNHADLMVELYTALHHGKPEARVEVPAWRDAMSRQQGPARTAEVFQDMLTDEALLCEVVEILGRASRSIDTELQQRADALCKALAMRHADWHCGVRS